MVLSERAIFPVILHVPAPMGFFSSIFGFFGFAFGLLIGLVIGYFLFIYWQPQDVTEPVIKPLDELDSKTLESLLPEMPLWVKNPDYDRVDWMNKFLRDIWPYLDKAICKMIRDAARPIFNEYCEKYNFSSIDFQNLTLGTLPPTIQGVKTFDTQESELIIEPALKWAGNPNILIVMKACGLKGTIQLVDFQVFAIVRLTLKPLIPSLPCFSKLVLSLMEKPHIDFGLKLLGGDLMAIPGLYGLVQDIVKEEVAKLYLWPKTLEIPILDDSKLANGKRPIGILHVKVLHARNLRRADFMGKSDPYVKISLGVGTPSKKTQVRKNTLNPDWNESFSFAIQDTNSQAMEFHVYDWEKVSSHDFLGMQIVPLASLTPNETKFMSLDLRKNMDDNDDSNKKTRGQISVEILYRPFRDEDGIPEEEDKGGEDAIQQNGGLLVVTVHKADDLEGSHHTNPYAKVVFKGQEYKTKPLKKTRDPKWADGRFEIACDKPPLNDKIRVEVMSKGMGIGLHLKEILGYVEINLGDVVRNQRIKDEYVLVDSRNGKVQVELEWLRG